MLRQERICSCSSREKGCDRLLRNSSAGEEEEDGREGLEKLTLLGSQHSSCTTGRSRPAGNGGKEAGNNSNKNPVFVRTHA